MTSQLNQRNKQLVHELWKALDNPSSAQQTAALDVIHPDVIWYGHEPVGTLHGRQAFLEHFWQPLLHAFPDLKRETFILFGGESNGRIDGDISKDGKMWVTGTGNLHATFSHDYLGIPASGKTVSIRWGEFCRLENDQIVEIYFLIDLIDLMQQAGIDVFPPAKGQDGIYPAPRAGDGVLLKAMDAAESRYSLEHIRRFIFDGLNSYDQDNLESMGMADYFHKDVKWYGPGGIGACLSFKEFEDFHQQPWLIAYPDRSVQNLDALIAEGAYSGAPGWAGVKATHTGPYLDCPATGNAINFNGLDWWKREDEQYIENWVFVDMVHLFQQFGIDVFARMREQIKSAL